MLKIDFDHYQGTQIADVINANLYEAGMLTIIEKLKPTFLVDGDQFCYILGELPEKNCIVGFGDTAYRAMEDFCIHFRSAKL